MSYCVNCGVELDATAKNCALCNTPVYNPKEIVREDLRTPYPTEKGEVEVVKRKDWAILLTTVVLATTITCAMLNFLVFQGTMWSLAVIGVCVIVWVIMIPVVIYTGQTIYISLLYDGIAVGVYLYMLAHMVDSFDWFWQLGLPVVVFVTVLAETLTFAIRKLPRSFLTMALYWVTTIGILCVGLELLIDGFLDQGYVLRWSAIVLTVCVIIDIAIITMLSLKRLRAAVRRRLHF